MSTSFLTVVPTSFELTPVYNDEEFRDAAGGVWVKGRTGNRWRLTMTFNNRSEDDRRALWAMIGEARGKQNRIRVSFVTYLNYRRAGVGGGTPQVTAALVAGQTSIGVSGAPASTTNWLAAGDFVNIEEELKLVTQQVDTDASGNATISVWPECHQNYPDTTVINTVGPRSDMFLVDVQGMSAVPFPNDWLSPAFTVTLEEDVYQ